MSHVGLGLANEFNKLGCMYRYGKGVRQDYGKALKYFNRAADLGSAVALDNLGYIYQSGKEVEQDYKKSARYYRRMAILCQEEEGFSLKYYLFDKSSVARYHYLMVTKKIERAKALRSIDKDVFLEYLNYDFKGRQSSAEEILESIHAFLPGDMVLSAGDAKFLGQVIVELQLYIDQGYFNLQMSLFEYITDFSLFDETLFSKLLHFLLHATFSVQLVQQEVEIQFVRLFQSYMSKGYEGSSLLDEDLKNLAAILIRKKLGNEFHLQVSAQVDLEKLTELFELEDSATLESVKNILGEGAVFLKENKATSHRNSLFAKTNCESGEQAVATTSDDVSAAVCK